MPQNPEVRRSTENVSSRVGVGFVASMWWTMMPDSQRSRPTSARDRVILFVRHESAAYERVRAHDRSTDLDRGFRSAMKRAASAPRHGKMDRAQAVVRS